MKRTISTAIGVDIAKNIVCRTPVLSQLAQRVKLHEGYTHINQTAYILGVFRQHAALLMGARGGDLIGADVLEIGPGGNVGVTLLMGLAGARSITCIDNIPWAHFAALTSLYRDLVAAAAAEPATYFVAPAYRARAVADPAGVVSELLGKLTYSAPDDISTTKLPSASYDAIFSHACFEHFADPAGSIAQIARLLRPGGATSHQVDLRDHRDFSRPLAHLQYPEIVWRMANSHRPHGVRNRWRVADYQACFARNELTVVSCDANQTTLVTDAMRRQFNPRFQAMPLTELGIISFMLVAQQQGAHQ